MKKLLVCAVGVGLLLTGCNGLRWSHEASEVAYQQVRPQVLLQKYERFKDMRAALDAKRASITQFQAQIEAMRVDFGGISLIQWPMDARESYQQRRSELHGMISSFNGLAASFNADMAKENFRFCDAGRMPQGLEGMEALPRSYAPYMTH